MFKTCTKCGETKSLDGFYRDKTKAGGRRPDCKECVRESNRRYRKENLDKERKRSRRYREENPEKEADRKRRYHEENRDKILDRKRILYEENRDERLEYFRRYREENRDELLEYERRYREENRDKLLELNRRYYEENRDELLEYYRRYREENRDILNQGRKIRQAQDTRISNLLASKKGVPYSPEEDALILCDNGMTDYQKAIELGRTHASVRTRKHHLRARANH